MNEIYDVTPVIKDSLTEEIIDALIQHPTISSLRRACATSPWIYKADSKKDMPTIYYVKGSVDPNENDWTMHALTSDLITYLLKGSINDSDSDDDDGSDDSGDDTPHDGVIEITSPNNLTSYTDLDSDGRIDIPNEATSEDAVTIGVKITMNDTEGTFTGEYYTGEVMPENPGQMSAIGNVLTADVELEADTEQGTPIMFKVTDGNEVVNTFVIAYGSSN